MGLVELAMLYAAIVAMVYVHELGHFGRRIRITQWLPFPVGQSNETKFRYGGLIANFLVALIISVWQPDSLFLQMFGLANWLHVIIYCFWGSFNKEYQWPRRLWKYVVFDDIPNELWWMFVPLGFLTMWIMRWCYFPIIGNVLRAIFGGGII